MDNDTLYKDQATTCPKCESKAVSVIRRKYACGCIESIILCAEEGCGNGEHNTIIHADFLKVCKNRKDIILAPAQEAGMVH